MKATRMSLAVCTALLLAACGDQQTTPLAPSAPEFDLPTLAQLTPPDFVPQDATCELITFDDMGLAHGDPVTSIDNLFGGAFTLTVEAVDLGPTSASPAKVYDTNTVGGPDVDLEWNNSDPLGCPNCEGQGNVLVIPNTDFNAEGDSDTGGTVRYTGFPTADPNDGDGQAWIGSFKGFDQEATEGAITLYIDGIERGATTGTGNGDYQVVDADPHGPIADKVELTRDGSGATDDIEVCFLPAPPPPPSVCIGLTPGYWKNWDNHYTTEQFQSLVDWVNAYTGESLTIDDIVDALSYGGPDAVQKLWKFYYSNLLTLALTDIGDLPNPDGAGLTEDCTLPDSSQSLADALDAAEAIFADPGSYKRKDINGVKDILDAFANMGDD